MGVRTHTRGMPDYGSALQFGLSVTPETAQIEAISELVQLADATGLDLVAIQDHAYKPHVPRYVDTDRVPGGDHA